MNQSLIEILLDISNREFYAAHKAEIDRSVAQRSVPKQPPLTDDEFWSQTEYIN